MNKNPRHIKKPAIVIICAFFVFGFPALVKADELTLSRPVRLADPVPPGPPAVSEVSIFFYPWWGTPAHDGDWKHWDQSGRVPPDSIGTNFYPEGGPYSSSDPAILDRQMQQIAGAGIDTVVVSWWGRGSFEDSTLPALTTAAKLYGIQVAIHIEPYGGRSAETLRDDIAYLRTLGSTQFYIYLSQQMASGDLASVNDGLDGSIRTFAETGNEAATRDGSFMQWAQDAHFDGIYTYDNYGYNPEDFRGICFNARMHHLLCAPSVGPGWLGTRATKIAHVRDRENGAVYDRYWQGAIDAQPDIVSITSFNEWHEGTQIEPAAENQCLPQENFCYSNYAGAYGKSGPDAAYAYLARTLHWSSTAKGRTLKLSQRMAIVSGILKTSDAHVLGNLSGLGIKAPPVSSPASAPVQGSDPAVPQGALNPFDGKIIPDPIDPTVAPFNAKETAPSQDATFPIVPPLK